MAAGILPTVSGQWLEAILGAWEALIVIIDNNKLNLQLFRQQYAAAYRDLEVIMEGF